MVHLPKKPSSNKGNQNAPNNNLPIVILGMMKIPLLNPMMIKTINEVRHYYYLQFRIGSGRQDGLSFQQHGLEHNMHEPHHLLQ